MTMVKSDMDVPLEPGKGCILNAKNGTKPVDQDVVKPIKHGQLVKEDKH